LKLHKTGKCDGIRGRVWFTLPLSVLLAGAEQFPSLYIHQALMTMSTALKTAL